MQHRSLPRSLRDYTPLRARRAIRSGIEAFGEWTSYLRLMPTFIIFGTQRGGTTALYWYLTQHPSVGASTIEEIHFFDLNYSKGVPWYRGHFPTIYYERWVARKGLRLIAGEATPYYMYHPLAAKRIKELLPGIKLIAMLRNPVDRAWSHYQHEVAYGREALPFEEAIEREPHRIAGEAERMLADSSYISVSHQRFSYLSRGMYVDQLKAWFDLFPREDLLILISERFRSDPTGNFRRVLEFLDLPPQMRSVFPMYNSGKYPPLGRALRRRLTDYFSVANEQLYELIGEDCGWNRG
jgi:hypothetical protein